MLLESLNIHLASNNVGGKKYCSSLVYSLASEFTNQKFSKTSTFSCPLISHSVILLIPPFPIYLLPNIGVWFAPKIFVRTCTTFVYILLLSCCCSKHTGSLGAHMPARERPESLAQKREKVYFRFQILVRPSIGEYWNISCVPVLPENVIFTFF